MTLAVIEAVNRRGERRSAWTMSQFLPPEMTQVLPLAIPSSPTRATFSAVSWDRSAWSGWRAMDRNSVVVGPGQRAQTFTPKGRNSSAMPSENRRSKPLVAE